MDIEAQSWRMTPELTKLGCSGEPTSLSHSRLLALQPALSPYNATPNWPADVTFLISLALAILPGYLTKCTIVCLNYTLFFKKIERKGEKRDKLIEQL